MIRVSYGISTSDEAVKNEIFVQQEHCLSAVLLLCCWLANHGYEIAQMRSVSGYSEVREVKCPRICVRTSHHA